VIGGQKVQVELFFPCLSNLIQFGANKSSVSIPNDINVQVDKRKRQFISSSGQFQDMVEADLESEFCSIQWPLSSVDEKCTLKCTLTRETVQCRNQVSEWAEKCKSLLDKHLSSVIDGEVSIPREIWNDYLQQLKNTACSEMQEMFTEQDDESCKFIYVGMDTVVSRFQGMASHVRSQLMEEVARAKKKRFELVTNLSAPKLRLLQQSKFWEKLQTDVEVSIDERGISFQGTEQKIGAAKMAMYELLNEFQQHTFSLDSFKLKLLKKPKIDEYFRNVFESKGWNVAWSIEKENIEILAKNGVSVRDVFSLINDGIILQKLALNASSVSALAVPQWKSVEEDLVARYQSLEIVLANDKSSFTFYGTCEDVKAAYDTVNNFLINNKTVERFVAMPKGTVQLFMRHKSADIKRITDDVPQGAIRFECIEEALTTGFVISGAEQYVSDAVRQFKSVCDGVFDVAHDCEVPGMLTYSSSQQGKSMIERIENDKKVIVFVSKDFVGSVTSGSETAPAVTASQPTDVQGLETLSQIKLKSGVSVAVVKGNIIECQVDAVVIPIESSLSLTSGPARAVSNSGVFIISYSHPNVSCLKASR